MKPPPTAVTVAMAITKATLVAREVLENQVIGRIVVDAVRAARLGPLPDVPTETSTPIRIQFLQLARVDKCRVGTLPKTKKR